MIRKFLSKEIIRYGISGVLITLANLGVYTGLLSLGMRFEIANLIALVLSRVAGFALNKYFVFRSTRKSRFWQEFLGFMVARGFSGLVDYFGLILLINQFHLHEVLAKGFVMVFVIVLNYVLGKFLVFRGKESFPDSPQKSENEQKYHSKNPLRRLLVRRLTDRIVSEALLERVRISGSRSSIKRADILDAGCGEGFVIQALHARAEEKTIIGLDVSEDALDVAKQSNPDAHFVLGSVCSLPFADGSVDTVLLCEVLEHLPDPICALSEAQRVAGSSIIVTVPLEPWFRLGNLLMLRHVSRLGNPEGHIQHWTHRQFQALIRANLRGAVHFFRCFPWSVAVVKTTIES
ncbi:MAG: GtrA family protein [Clostridiaceae bacterium]